MELYFTLFFDDDSTDFFDIGGFDEGGAGGTFDPLL
jgi:hypothetical protein